MTLVASMTDSLMMGEQCDLMLQQMSREAFDEKFESHRRKFNATMKNQISLMLPDGVMPEIGQRVKY